VRADQLVGGLAGYMYGKRDILDVIVRGSLCLKCGGVEIDDEIACGELIELP